MDKKFWKELGISLGVGVIFGVIDYKWEMHKLKKREKKLREDYERSQTEAVFDLEEGISRMEEQMDFLKETTIDGKPVDEEVVRLHRMFIDIALELKNEMNTPFEEIKRNPRAHKVKMDLLHKELELVHKQCADRIHEVYGI